MQISIDLSELGATVIQLDDSTTNEAAADADVLAITGATDLGTASDAGDGLLVVNVTGGLADTDALETALEVGGSAALTVDGAVAVSDAIIAAYTDGTDTYIAKVVFGSIVADANTIAQGSLSATNLVKLQGITDLTTISDADLTFA